MDDNSDNVIPLVQPGRDEANGVTCHASKITHVDTNRCPGLYSQHASKIWRRDWSPGYQVSA